MFEEAEVLELDPDVPRDVTLGDGHLHQAVANLAQVAGLQTNTRLIIDGRYRMFQNLCASSSYNSHISNKSNNHGTTKVLFRGPFSTAYKYKRQADVTDQKGSCEGSEKVIGVGGEVGY